MRLWHRSEKPITPQSRRNDLKVFNMRVHLSALGCRLNEAELERWASAFHKAGDSIASSADDADVLVLNSCAVSLCRPCHAGGGHSPGRIRLVSAQPPARLCQDPGRLPLALHLLHRHGSARRGGQPVDGGSGE